MTEPVYEYVKGKGWILQEDELLLVTTNRAGQTRKIYKRVPRRGDMWFHVPSTWPEQDVLKLIENYIQSSFFDPDDFYWRYELVPKAGFPYVVTVTT